MANNAFEAPGALGSSYPARSTVTFEAKDGRFRMTFSDLEELITPQMGWQTVAFSRSKTEILNGIAERIADCVKAPKADW